eukprot:gene9994-2169_t
MAIPSHILSKQDGSKQEEIVGVKSHHGPVLSHLNNKQKIVPDSENHRLKSPKSSTSTRSNINIIALKETMQEDWMRLQEANLQLRSLSFEDDSKAPKLPISTRVTMMLSLGGNMLISAAKFYAYTRTGHSAMLSEAIHTLVDVGNQQCQRLALVQSTPGIKALLYPPAEFTSFPETWAILTIGLVVDGFVLRTALHNTRMRANKEGTSVLRWLLSFRDPFTVAIVFEDSAAVAGVLVAGAGIALTEYTGNPMYDGLATLCISALLGSVSLKLIQMNRSFILGRPVEDEILLNLRWILKRRQSVDEVHSEKSQWIGPSLFSYKAEVDFDGTWLAVQLFEKYQPVFLNAAVQGADTLQKDLAWLLPAFAEDVTRVLEREVRDIQQEVRRVYPAAGFVEIVPDSSQSTLMALEVFLKKKASRLVEQYQVEAMLSGNSPQHHSDHYNLGSFYLGMGQYEKAAEQFETCYSQRITLLGHNSEDVIACLERLGHVYRLLGDHARALQSLQQATSAVSVLGSDVDPLLIASIFFETGMVQQVTGHVLTACRSFQEALNIRQQYLDQLNPGILSLLLSLGDLFSGLPAQRSKALNFYQELLKRRIMLFGDKDLRVADVHHKLAMTCRTIGQNEKALEYAAKAAVIKEQCFRSSDPIAAAIAWEQVADLFLLLKQYSKAQGALERGLRILGDVDQRVDDPDVMRLVHKLIDIYHKFGVSIPSSWR